MDMNRFGDANWRRRLEVMSPFVIPHTNQHSLATRVDSVRRGKNIINI